MTTDKSEEKKKEDIKEKVEHEVKTYGDPQSPPRPRYPNDDVGWR